MEEPKCIKNHGHVRARKASRVWMMRLCSCSLTYTGFITTVSPHACAEVAGAIPIYRFLHVQQHRPQASIHVAMLLYESLRCLLAPDFKKHSVWGAQHLCAKLCRPVCYLETGRGGR